MNYQVFQATNKNININSYSSSDITMQTETT
jgi:hypothetical protein